MKLPGSSSRMRLTNLDRIRQFFLTELPGFPSPPPETPGVKVFCASRFWKSNVCGAVVAGIGAVAVFTVVGVTLLWQSQGREGRLWGAGMICFAFVAVWALLVGNAAAMYPYAVEIEKGKGFRFYAPFKKFYIPTQEVRRVKWSWLSTCGVNRRLRGAPRMGASSLGGAIGVPSRWSPILRDRPISKT